MGGCQHFPCWQKLFRFAVATGVDRDQMVHIYTLFTFQSASFQDPYNDNWISSNEMVDKFNFINLDRQEVMKVT